MNILSNRSIMRWSLGLVLMTPLALAANELDSTHGMPSDGLLQVENVAGSVDITAWDRDEVHVTGTVGSSVEEVKIDTTGNGLRVVVHNKDSGRTRATHLHLKVPMDASVEVEGVSADITVNGSRGDTITLATVSGDLEVDAEPNRLELASVSGDVEFQGRAVRTNTETVSGDMTLIGVGGEIQASTVSGDLTLEGGEIDNARFETVSGELHLMLEVMDGGRLDCDAMSGDINLRLPSSQKAAFSAQSYSGGINSEFGEPMKHSKSPSGSYLKAQVGDNGARIRLETFSGDISIRAR